MCLIKSIPAQVCIVGLEDESGFRRNASPWTGYRWSLAFEFEETDLHAQLARAVQELLTRERLQELRRDVASRSAAAARRARKGAVAALGFVALAEALLLGGTERAVRKAVRSLGREASPPDAANAARPRFCDRFFLRSCGYCWPPIAPPSAAFFFSPALTPFNQPHAVMFCRVRPS